MGKKMKNLKRLIKTDISYSLNEALKILQEKSFVKFDESIDVAIRLGVDAKNSAHNISNNVMLPHGNGKKVKIAVICQDNLIKDVEKAGGDIVGNSDIIDSIKQQKINFDICICDISMVNSISAVAKILGPKGLMPSTKNKTLVSDVLESVKNFKSGYFYYRMDKNAIIHASVGRLSFTLDKLIANVRSFVDSVKKCKPQDFKGVFLKNISISSTMGLGLTVDLVNL